MSVLTSLSLEEQNEAKSKKQQHKDKAAANEAKVNADIKAKEDAARQQV
jgi:hypothetical protein